MHHNMMRTMVNTTVGWMDAGTHRLIPCAFVYSSSVVVEVAEIAQVFASSPSRRRRCRASYASCSSAPGWLAVSGSTYFPCSIFNFVGGVSECAGCGGLRELRGNEENSFRRVPWENLSCYWRTDYNFYYLCLNRISKFAPEREHAEYLLLWGWLVCASFPTLISLRTCNEWKGSANKSEFIGNEAVFMITEVLSIEI